MQQKRISNGDKLISPAEYARRLHVARSTICRQIQRGVFPLHDGKVNAAEADRCRADRLDSFRGRNTVAQRRERPARESGPTPMMTLGRDELQFIADESYRKGQLATIEGLVRPGNLVTVAELSSALGCSLQQAVNVANLYRFMLMVWTLDDKEKINVEEPDWIVFAAQTGKKVTRKQIKAWMAESGPAVEKWYAAHPQVESTATGEAQSGGAST